VSTTTVVIISVLFFLVPVIYCLINSRIRKINLLGFQNKITTEKQKVRVHASRTPRSTIVGTNDSPVNGNYEISYSDRRTIRQGKVTLMFEDNGTGYTISGSVQDADGESKINDGFACYDGLAYWKDNCVESRSGNVGLSVISNGTFDYRNKTFTGKWMSSTGFFGEYTNFSYLGPVPGQEMVPINKHDSQHITATVVSSDYSGEPDITVEAIPVHSDGTGADSTQIPAPAAQVQPSLFDQMQSTFKKK